MIGRFLQRDPAGLAAGSNAYAYCANVPTVAVDPSGRFLHIVADAIIGAFIGGISNGIDLNPSSGGVGWNWGNFISGAIGGGVAGGMAAANPAMMAVGNGVGNLITAAMDSIMSGSFGWDLRAPRRPAHIKHYMLWSLDAHGTRGV